MKVKGEWKCWLKTQHSKNWDHGTQSHHFMANRCEKKWKHWQILFSWAPKSLKIVTAAMKSKDTPWKESYDKPTQHIQKQRHHLTDKDLSSQSYGFSSSHVSMWKFDHKESWAPKNWWFWIALKKTLESPFDSKGITLAYPKGNQPWIFIGRTDAEASILWPPDAKNWFIGKDPDLGKNWG